MKEIQAPNKLKNDKYSIFLAGSIDMGKRIPHNKIIWAENEIKFIRENFRFKSDNEMALILNKSKKNVGKQLRIQGLYRNSEDIKNILTRLNKKRNTDLSHEYVLNMTIKYETRGDFLQFEPNAYNKAIKMGWIDDVSKHMKINNVSTPQLLLKHYLEQLLKEDCSFNNRKIIKPYELDCYFDKYKIAWEYNGKRYHTNNEKDLIKEKMCCKENIKLFIINEISNNYRNYENNIKTQLIRDLDDINKITKLNINYNDVMVLNNNFIYPKLLSDKEIKLIKNKKLSEIKNVDVSLFNKIKRYKLFLNDEYQIINDTKKNIKHKNYNDYIEYLNIQKYKKFSDLCNNEHPHRLSKKLGFSIKQLRIDLKIKIKN